MTTQRQRGVLVISVDVTSDNQGLAVSSRQALESGTELLFRLFEKCQTPATWSMEDLTLVRHWDALRRAGHDVAVLAQPRWAAPSAGRREFAAELSRQAGLAEAAGSQLATLVLRGFPPNRHTDLLIKHGVRAVRSLDLSYCRGSRSPLLRIFRAENTEAAPSAIRFGLWDVPATLDLPGGASPAKVRQQIDRAAATGGYAHLAIHVGQLAELKHGAYRLEQVLQHARQLRGGGRIRIETVAGLAARLATPRQLQPSRSILRAA